MKYWYFFAVAISGCFAVALADVSPEADRKDYTIMNKFDHTIVLEFDDGNGGSFMVIELTSI